MNFVACVATVVAVMLSVSALKADPINITLPSDPIYAIWDTTAGGDSTASNAEQTGSAYGLLPANAIDANVYTKYLNFGNGPESESSATKGVGTGFYVTPSMGKSILTGFYFATADDSAERDPMSLTIEGSNATGDDLTLGSSWTQIYSGTSGVAIDPGRSAWGSLVSLAANSTSYASYRLLVTGQRDVANCIQYGEVSLKGYAIPEPSSLVVLTTGLLGLLAYAWRKWR